MPELYATVRTKVDVTNRQILEHAVNIVRQRTQKTEGYYLSSDGKTLMHEIDHGNHRGGFERNTVREATEEDKFHLAMIKYLEDAVRAS